METKILARGRILLGYSKVLLTDVNYFPYLHLIIALLFQATIFCSFWYYARRSPAPYLANCPMMSSLNSQSIVYLRIIVVTVAAALVFDLLLDLYSFRITSKKADDPLMQLNSSTNWKEFTLRCMFVACFTQPNIIMLFVPRNEYAIVVAVATTQVQNVMFFSICLFVVSYAYQSTIPQRCLSLALSLTFVAGQLVTFYASLSACPSKWNPHIRNLGTVLYVVPPILYLMISLYLSRNLLLTFRASSANSKIPNKEILFVANFSLASVWFIFKFAMAAYQQSLFIPRLEAANTVIFDVIVILFALMATVYRAWSARLESKKAQLIVTRTKRNIAENLTYPLLEISVGLSVLLASAFKEMESDAEGKKNLSRIAQACNMAVNALDDMTYSDKYNTSRSDTAPAESRRYSFANVTRNFDPDEEMDLESRRREFPSRIVSYRKKKVRAKQRVVYEGPRDYDSEMSEIHDTQTLFSGKQSIKSANNTEFPSLPKPSFENRRLTRVKRPSINLLALSNLSPGSTSIEIDPAMRQLGSNNRARVRRNFNKSFYSLEEKDEDKSSDDASVRETGKINGSSMSSSIQHNHNINQDLSLIVNSPLSPTGSATFYTHPDLNIIPPMKLRCHSSLSRATESSIRSVRPSSPKLFNTTTSSNAPDPYSPSLSVGSSALSTQLIIAPCTPLQLYCYMPDSGSVGFECPFSALAPSNQVLLDLLGLSHPDFMSVDDIAEGPGKHLAKYANVATHHKLFDVTNCHIVAPSDIPKNVLFRSLSALANSTFIPIQSAFGGMNGATAATGTYDILKYNRRSGKCDMLSQFTWKLLQVFYGDLKSTFNVYEVFLGAFASPSRHDSSRALSPYFNNSPGAFSVGGQPFSSTSPTVSGGPSPVIFTNPTLLTYEALCNLEEYLNGTLALFVKASASLLAAVDNVAVMKERRRRGIF